MPEASGSVSDQVRSACEWVAGRAHSVRIEAGAVETYAAELTGTVDRPPPDPATELVVNKRQTRADIVHCLDAINFCLL